MLGMYARCTAHAQAHCICSHMWWTLAQRSKTVCTAPLFNLSVYIFYDVFFSFLSSYYSSSSSLVVVIVSYIQPYSTYATLSNGRIYTHTRIQQNPHEIVSNSDFLKIKKK